MCSPGYIPGEERVDRRLREAGYSLEQVVEKIKERTGASFFSCKKALVFVNGYPRSAENLLLMAERYKR